jgi:hypothetical protein
VASVFAVSLLACERKELLGVIVAEGEAGGAGGEPGLVPDEPRIVDTISDATARDTDPSFTDDRTELYFMSDRTGNKEIWRSLRRTPDDPWGTPELVTALNCPTADENPFVSNDGLAIWFFTDRDRALGSQWRSRRVRREDDWGPPEPVPELAFGEGSSDVAIAADPGETLFILNAKPTGPPPYRLYQMERALATDPLGPPELLSEVVSTANEYDPDLRQNGLVLAFDSAREGAPQIYWTRRAARDMPFLAPVPVPALVSSYGDSAPAFSEDLRYVLFSSDRSGNSEIYEAILSEPLE